MNQVPETITSKDDRSICRVFNRDESNVNIASNNSLKTLVDGRDWCIFKLCL